MNMPKILALSLSVFVAGSVFADTPTCPMYYSTPVKQFIYTPESASENLSFPSGVGYTAKYADAANNPVMTSSAEHPMLDGYSGLVILAHGMSYTYKYPIMSLEGGLAGGNPLDLLVTQRSGQTLMKGAFFDRHAVYLCYCKPGFDDQCRDG